MIENIFRCVGIKWQHKTCGLVDELAARCTAFDGTQLPRATDFARALVGYNT